MSFSRALIAAERVVTSTAAETSTSTHALSKLTDKLKNQFTPSSILQNFFYTPSIAGRVRLRHQSTLAVATTPSNNNTSSSATDIHRSIIGASNLSFLTDNIRKLIKSEHPLLNSVSQYYFNADGKKLRPLLVLLMSKATVFSPNNPCVEIKRASGQDPHVTLAMITELIHTASLLHDDVIDGADMRRSMPSANHEYGNKMAILGGDFLLSRASVALARLGNVRVVELMAEVIGELVEGEVMQFRGNQTAPSSEQTVELLKAEYSPSVLFPSTLVHASQISDWHLPYFHSYLRKTYLKTASLMAKSCQSAVLLHPGSHETVDQEQIAFEYGKNLGIAFQLVDDMLDYTATEKQLGKPAGGNDLKLGLATAPVLYGSIEYPELRDVIDRKSPTTSDDSYTAAIKKVCSSRGLALTRHLAEWHCQRAEYYIKQLAPSDARDALISISKSVLDRNK